MESPVVFIDSGIGGLPYLEESRKRLPGRGFIYIADNDFFPYGEKRDQAIKERMSWLVSCIKVQFDPEVIVLACNSASVSALATLREEYNIPFVGVVPAVKPAAERSRTGKIGVMATQKTVDAPYLENLISLYAAECETHCFAAGDIVSYVEEEMINESDDQRVYSMIEPVIEKFRHKGVDTIVLGCTHFLHVEQIITRIAGNEIEIIDSAKGVARQLTRILKNKRNGCEQEESLLYTTSLTNGKTYPEMAIRFGLVYKGSLFV